MLPPEVGYTMPAADVWREGYLPLNPTQCYKRVSSSLVITPAEGADAATPKPRDHIRIVCISGTQ
jgi:hypothetical protein